MNNYELYVLIANAIATNNLIDVAEDLLEEITTINSSAKIKYGRYKAEIAEIFDRTMPQTDKVNNKVNHDFIGDIVDTKVGYMVGNPVTYAIDSEDAETKVFANNVLKDFLTQVTIEDLDTDTVQQCAICGYSYRLIHLNQEGIVDLTLVDAWKGHLVYNPDGGTAFGILLKEKSDDVYDMYIYDKNFVYILKSNNDGVIAYEEEPIPHLCGDVPLVRFQNNNEMQGDCDKVINLINAYDRTYSDVDSELEQFRLAYLALFGVAFDKDQVNNMRQTGAISMPQGSDAKFITKQLNDSIIENHLDRAEKNILRFSKSVNFQSTEFATSSGIALKFKLLGLENKALKTERKLSKAMRQQFKLICNLWNIAYGINFNYLDVWWQFKRNVPIDILSEATASATLKGLVSEETRLSMLGFVSDIDYEINKIDEQSNIDLGE